MESCYEQRAYLSALPASEEATVSLLPQLSQEATRPSGSKGSWRMWVRAVPPAGCQGIPWSTGTVLCSAPQSEESWDDPVDVAF